MNGKVKFRLMPVSGAVPGTCYRAVLDTAKGDAVDLAGVINEARDLGYLPAGIKSEAAKSVVTGVLDSMIAGVLRDGRTRRLGDYFSVSLKVHGRFEDAHDEFDPERHRLALSLKQLSEFRPSFRDIEATNIDHKRQFRVYSAKTVDSDLRSGRLIQGREFVVKGADMRPGARLFAVSLAINPGPNQSVSEGVRVISATDTEIRCAWPERMMGEEFVGKSGEVAVYRCEHDDDVTSVVRRSTSISVAPPEP